MKRLFTLAPFIFLAFMLIAGGALAQGNGRYTLTSSDPADGKYKARPGIFDPDHTGIVAARWINQIGLQDDRGNGYFALYLQKSGPTATNAAAGANIDGVTGQPAIQFGFDYRADGQCTGGAPRFNVEASDGFHFVGGCGNGTITPNVAPGWNRVTFDPHNPAQSFPVIAPGATLISVTLILDEGTDSGPGYAYLDNINVDGQYITKPGAAK